MRELMIVGVSAVIVTYRTGPALADALAALAKVSGLNEFVVVDNGNPEAEVQLLDHFASGEARMRIVRGHGNVGFARGCNLGARMARGTMLVFVNPDVILRPGSIQQMCDAMPVDPAIVGGDLRDLLGRPARGARRERLTLWRALVSFTGLSRFERLVPALRDFNRDHDPLPSGPVEVGAVSGALMAMRRVDFDALGGFDEGYFLHVEDVDLCRRAQDAGWKILFLPGPHGVHIGSTSDVAAREVARHKALSFARYFRKFSASPLERMLARASGAVLGVLLPLMAKR